LPPVGEDVLRVAVVRLPRISNFTDVDALSAEPGVVVHLVTTRAEAADADLLVLPGTRATVADLAWLRARGLAEVVARRAAAGRPVLGICGGYQMLGRVIEDDGIEAAGRSVVDGIGVLPVGTVFAAEKVLGRPKGVTVVGGAPVVGYEIHHGHLDVDGGEPLFRRADGVAEGCRVGAVAGTVWHGTLENDAYRRGLLAEVSAVVGKRWLPGDVSFAEVRERRLDALGDLVADHLDTQAVRHLLDRGMTAGLPTVGPYR
jgi:adenosylcobyric acid synthase